MFHVNDVLNRSYNFHFLENENSRTILISKMSFNENLDESAYVRILNWAFAVRLQNRWILFKTLMQRPLSDCADHCINIALCGLPMIHSVFRPTATTRIGVRGWESCSESSLGARAILKKVLCPGSKVILVSLTNYMENIFQGIQMRSGCILSQNRIVIRTYGAF